mmetsp:Transcript_3354/g.8688  ORF Transcript_3354/g.8688 Transcript_3354/m.8688 type:complete len:107 (+) Transcript_3354:600-920(+)
MEPPPIVVGRVERERSREKKAGLVRSRYASAVHATPVARRRRAAPAMERETRPRSGRADSAAAEEEAVFEEVDAATAAGRTTPPPSLDLCPDGVNPTCWVDESPSA